MNRMLGRIAPTAEQKRAVPRLNDYLTRPLPAAPPTCNNTEGAQIAMFGNDRYGCCTISALANYDAICSSREGVPLTVTDAEVIKAYLALTGGKDEGAAETHVLTHARSLGFDFGGPDPWKLATFLSVPLRNTSACKSLISIFNGLYLGASLPVAAQSQSVWKTPASLLGDNAPGSWGGHALLWGNYDETNEIELVTWGSLQRAEYGWLSAYCDEAYVLLDAQRAEMIGVDWDALLADLRSVPHT